MNEDLISRNKLYAEICGLPSNIGLYEADEVERLVKAAPAVDAVVPVYCKDCYNKEKTDRERFIRCVQLGIEVPDIFFCRYGDREG